MNGKYNITEVINLVMEDKSIEFINNDNITIYWDTYYEKLAYLLEGRIKNDLYIDKKIYYSEWEKI